MVCFKHRAADKQNFQTTLKDSLSRCNQSKRKTVVPHITHLMRSLVLLTIFFQLVENCR